MNHLGIERAVLAAHDIGAVMAQVLARAASDRIAALALFNPPYPGIGQRRLESAAQSETWHQYFHNLPLAEYLVGYNRDTVRLYLAHFYGYWLGRKDALRPAEFEAIVDAYARPGAFGASIACYRSGVSSLSQAPIADPRTLKIRQCTYVLWGEADPVMRVAWADRLTEFFTQCRYRLLPGVGHFVPFEAPDEAIAAITQSLQVLSNENA